MNNPSFVTFVTDQLAGLGDVRVRKMFGGAGLYLGDVMFGLIDDSRLFFRAAPASASRFEERGMRPFEPWAGHVMKGYWEVPADVLEDADAAQEWGRRAVDDAKALKKPKRKQASRSRTS